VENREYHEEFEKLKDELDLLKNMVMKDVRMWDEIYRKKNAFIKEDNEENIKKKKYCSPLTKVKRIKQERRVQGNCNYLSNHILNIGKKEDVAESHACGIKKEEVN
jgi:hypothetical protein